MPHECTDCGRAFDDGSKEMLSGCPDCGGNKFQFKPAGRADSTPEEESPEPPEPPDPAVDNSVARTVGNAATAVRDLVGSDESAPDPAGTPTPDRPETTPTDRLSPATGDESAPTDTPTTSNTPRPDSPSQSETVEDTAQASARTDVVSRDDLPPAPETTRSRPAPVMDGQDDADDATPDLDQLREELNQQFESIRVLEPGQYELNLMELYNREEYIIALQEDGKYTIQVPERWEEA